MAEKNNKIKISDLLAQANVQNLNQYFNELDAEVSIEYLLDGLSNKMDKGGAQLDSKVVSDVFTLVSRIWKNYREEKGDFKLGRLKINVMFGVLYNAIDKDDTNGLKAKAVFDLVEEVWNARKDAKDDFMHPNLSKNEVDLMFAVLNHAIEKGGTSELKSQSVFDLVENIFDQQNLDIDRQVAISMLEALRLTRSIDVQSKELKLLLRVLDLNIASGRICLADENKGSSLVDKADVISMLKIIQEQSLEEKKNQENDNLKNVEFGAWDIIKTFFWRLFCCWENPFHSLRNYTKLRVSFNQLKTQLKVGQGQNWRNSKLLKSAEQQNLKAPELKNKNGNSIE